MRTTAGSRGLVPKTPIHERLSFDDRSPRHSRMSERRWHTAFPFFPCARMQVCYSVLLSAIVGFPVFPEPPLQAEGNVMQGGLAERKTRKICLSLRILRILPELGWGGGWIRTRNPSVNSNQPGSCRGNAVRNLARAACSATCFIR